MTVSKRVSQHEAPLPVTPPRPPTAPADAPLLHLDVEGFATAVYTEPVQPTLKAQPVTVVLHGNYDRPEWECEVWKTVAGFYGWVVCPRGIPTPWAKKSEDRWMYRGSEQTAKEIDAVLTALKNKYPGSVAETNMVLAGFSLGAILAPHIVIRQPNRFTALFLVEGGLETLDKHYARALTRSGITAIGFAMSSPKLRNLAKTLVPLFQKQGLKTEYVDMAGAGHDYHPAFSSKGREALLRMLTVN